MKRLVKYLESIGLKPYRLFIQHENGVVYSDGQAGWVSVDRWRGKTYYAQRVKVYTENAISRTSFESTRMSDIIGWIDAQLGIRKGELK